MIRAQGRSRRFMAGMLGMFILTCLSMPDGALADTKVSKIIDYSDGDGIVQSIDFRAQTIKVTDVTVRVTERTKLFDKEGNQIRLRDIRSEKTSRNPDRVQYWTRKGRGNGVPEVIRLEVMGPWEG